jgi:ankyrin repeat protein
MYNSRNTKFDLVKLIDSSPEVLKNAIKDVDLRTLDKETIGNLIKKAMRTEPRYTMPEKIYILVDNPKGGIDINSSFKGTYIITFFTHSDDVEKFRYLVEKYRPNINVRTIHGDTLLAASISYETIGIAKVLLENGADINEKTDGYGYMRQLYGLELEDSRPFYNLFLKHGIDIDQVIDLESEYNSLMSSIAEGNKEKFNLSKICFFFSIPLRRKTRMQRM